MNLDELNSLEASKARQLFYDTCACEEFAEKMEKLRPFKDLKQMKERAENLFNSLSKEQWKEAFEGHPKIGDVQSLKKKFQSTQKLAEGEQSSVNEASEEVITDLALYNEKYLTKFGYIFIVCATGKSANEMLTILRKRIENNPEEEIYLAAQEQLEITLLRLEKL